MEPIEEVGNTERVKSYLLNLMEVGLAIDRALDSQGDQEVMLGARRCIVETVTGGVFVRVVN
jgi:hypothetical protein